MDTFFRRSLVFVLAGAFGCVVGFLALVGVAIAIGDSNVSDTLGQLLAYGPGVVGLFIGMAAWQGCRRREAGELNTTFTVSAYVLIATAPVWVITLPLAIMYYVLYATTWTLVRTHRMVMSVME